MESSVSKSSFQNIKWVKKVGEYYISNVLLGTGEYSEVYLGCLYKDFTQKVACKIMKTTLFEQDPYILETLNRQYDMLKPLNQENIVKFFDMKQTGNNWYFFFEFCSLGTLESYLLKKKGKISEAKALLIFLDICEGFKALYRLNIIHRDLKPANVLMAENGVKISDFSFAKVLHEKQKNELLLQSLVGTPVYTPLQILEGREYSSKCDIWSLGVMFYQMLCGRLPFIWKAIERNQLTGSLTKLAEEIAKNTLDYPVGLKLSKNIKYLIEKMLQKEEKTRISWEELFIEIDKLDFKDLNEIPPELKGINTIIQQENMERSGLNKAVNMGKSGGIMSMFYSRLKMSQRFVEEDIRDIDLDEMIGGVEIPESKGIINSFNSLNNL